MKGFFAYESPYRTGNFIDLSVGEYIVPFIVLFAIIGVLFYYRHPLRLRTLFQRRFERIIGIVFAVIYASHYVLRFSLYGFDPILLPFQLCGISMFVAIILLFTRQRTLHAFVLYTGVLGGLVSMFTPIIGYDSSYYRYYQFYVAHILLIVVPLYYLIVVDYIPTKKQVWNAFWIVQGLIVFMGIFNLIFGTDFMFVFLDPAKEAKFPALNYFGGVPYYIIVGEIAVVAAFYLLYKATNFFVSLRVEEVEYKNA